MKCCEQNRLRHRTIALMLLTIFDPGVNDVNGQERASGALSGSLPAILDDRRVAEFAELALKGLLQEYPNKPSNVLTGDSDVRSPSQMHPVFYGCFDWHSSVHGHWMLARLLKLFPQSSVADRIRQTLNAQLTESGLLAEADYFQQVHNRSFERMYGWAWLLQLVGELHEWNDPDAVRWQKHLRPLELQIVRLIQEYLPKLSHPVRTGIHPDSGFALALIHDYARRTENSELAGLVAERALAFYRSDVDYPTHYEPSGNDFFSSGFNEADLMRRILPQDEFAEWLSRFLPELSTNRMGPMMQPVHVTDVTDGHLVHLAGLNLSRAWTMAGIASALPSADVRRAVLQSSADQHFEAGLNYVTSGHYEGEHWLATFAVYYATASFSAAE
ncbi:MAG: DUF2891 domain-containing protein [Planctomycetaceae bacterium]